jgi:hypothetical protein
MPFHADQENMNPSDLIIEPLRYHYDDEDEAELVAKSPAVAVAKSPTVAEIPAVANSPAVVKRPVVAKRPMVANSLALAERLAVAKSTVSSRPTMHETKPLLLRRPCRCQPRQPTACRVDSATSPSSFFHLTSRLVMIHVATCYSVCSNCRPR